MSRFSLKIVGSQGQGVVSTGDILAKAFKRSGYCVFGYREYMSIIKGGYTSYQIDISPTVLRSSEEMVDILLCLNHHGLEHGIREVKKGGLIIHDTLVWDFPKEDAAYLKKHNITVLFLPVAEILKRINAKPILANVVFASFVRAATGGSPDRLRELVQETFGHKKDLLALNFKAIEEGYKAFDELGKNVHLMLPAPDATWEKHLLLTGSQAMGLGIVAAGCRLYVGYPMTPSSPLLSYIASIQNETGMVVKQAEDEITAAQMMTGAMLAGTRAVTATSGGGFDLMTETVSLNGIIENPSVFVLAQRPGPATGLPTWTAQGDLMLAVFGGHGEFARCVLSVSDAEDAYSLMPEAFNIADRYQTPVIVLTDKHTAEGIYTQEPYSKNGITVERGNLVTAKAELRKLRSADRFNPHAEDGISKRWLPGSEAATYCAQGDEHSPDGSVDESAKNAVEQMDKRMKKFEAMKRDLPEPLLYTNHTEDSVNFDLLIVSWGSTAGVILDVLDDPALSTKKIGYLHFEYVWPLKTDLLLSLMMSSKKTLLVEGNATGQLGKLIKMETGTSIQQTFLKYDGRPFFYGELLAKITSHIPS